jgi:hypothetical protein
MWHLNKNLWERSTIEEVGYLVGFLIVLSIPTPSKRYYFCQFATKI